MLTYDWKFIVILLGYNVFFVKLGYLAKMFEVKTSQLSFQTVLGTIHRRVQTASVHFFGLPSQKWAFSIARILWLTRILIDPSLVIQSFTVLYKVLVSN